MVWLPRDALTAQQVRAIKSATTVYPVNVSGFDDRERAPIRLWREELIQDLGLALGVPRGFYERAKRKQNDEVIRVAEGAPMGDAVTTTLRFEGPFAQQEGAIQRLINVFEDAPYGGQILQAGCGVGKSIMALETARRLGRRTLIVVHKEFLLRQFVKHVETKFPGATVGVIRQAKCEYERDFVVALVQSLAKGLTDPTRYPKEMWSSFGLIITDEVHRISAQTWAPVAGAFPAKYRLGLTATPRRKDGAEGVFFQHIGPIRVKLEKEMPVPSVRKVETYTRLKPIRRGRFRVNTEDMKPSQVTSQLCEDLDRTKQIVDEIVREVRVGRKVLVISERLGHLRDLAAYTADRLDRLNLPFEWEQDFYTGAWFSGGTYDKGRRKGQEKQKTRTRQELEQAERANVVYATKQMVEEGLDIPAADVLVLATPIGDVEQAVGRVRRHCAPEPDKCAHFCPWRAGVCQGKPEPKVIDVVDINVPQLRGRARKRERFYQSLVRNTACVIR